MESSHNGTLSPPPDNTSSKSVNPKKGRSSLNRRNHTSSKPTTRAKGRPQFLFVPNAGPLPSQSRRVKQICNAHVQYNAHRRRSIAKQKLSSYSGPEDDETKSSLNSPPATKHSSPSADVSQIEYDSSVFPSPATSYRSKPAQSLPSSPYRNEDDPELPVRRRVSPLATTPETDTIRYSSGQESPHQQQSPSPSDTTIDVYRSPTRPSLPNPQSLLDPHDFDPFNTTPGPLPRGVQYLIQHFWQVVVPSYFPRLKNPRAYAEWFLPIMINDSAALNSSIFAWSAHLEVVKGLSVTDRSVASTPQWPQHRLRAIQAVNAKLIDPRQALEVSTLLAVGNLMAANVSQAVSIMVPGNLSELNTYAEGFQSLLNLRGGWHGFPTHIVKVFLRLRYFSALLAGHLPPSPPPVPIRPFLFRNISSLGDLPELGSGFTPLLTAGLISPLFYNIVTSLAAVTRSKTSYMMYRHLYSTQDLEFFTLQDLDIEYQLLLFGRLEQSIIVLVQEPLRVSLLIFYHSSIAEHQPTRQVIQFLTKKLHTALSHVFADFEGPYLPTVQEALIWALCMGAHISAAAHVSPGAAISGAPQLRNAQLLESEAGGYHWFVNNVAEAARALPNLNTFEDLSSLMYRFFYVERAMRTSLERIWEDVCELTDEPY